MENTEKKQWETPKIENLSAQKTDGASLPAPSEDSTFYSTSFPF